MLRLLLPVIAFLVVGFFAFILTTGISLVIYPHVGDATSGFLGLLTYLISGYVAWRAARLIWNRLEP